MSKQRIITGIRAIPVGTRIRVPWTWGDYYDRHETNSIVWGRERKEEEYYLRGTGSVLRPNTPFWRIAAWLKSIWYGFRG